MSLRTQKAGELIRDILSELFQRKIKDRIGFASITSVEVTPDFSEAFVYVSVLGPEADRKKTMQTLIRSTGFLRKELGHAIELRHTPKLIFREDTSLEYGSNIIAKLNKLKKSS